MSTTTNDFTWTSEAEQQLLDLRDIQRKTFDAIATALGTTASSVKHKYRRLTQHLNQDRYHHPTEKIDQIKRVLPLRDYHTLETHCGWGNLTSTYQQLGTVLALDIDHARTAHVNAMCMEDVDTLTCDSIKELHHMVYQRLKFDVIDIDPYGMPSRYFPHAFELIHDGYLFVTFPKLGVQKINKIMVEHLRVFWGITLDAKDEYQQRIHQRMADLGMQSFRKVELLDTLELARVYRFAYRVERRSALELVGLEVNRRPRTPKHKQMQLDLLTGQGGVTSA